MMGSLDEISEAIGSLRAEMRAVQRTVTGMDEKVDVLGHRMTVVEQLKERFETVEHTVDKHERLVQRGTGVWIMIWAVGTLVGGFFVDVAKRFFS